MAGKARILVADDDRLIRTLFSDILEGFGYTAILASDGEEALRKVRAEPPDLIMLDIMMPKRNGIQVAQELKNHPATSGIPIIMVTSLPGTPAAQVSRANAYLQKPFRPEDLLKQVSALLPAGGAPPKPSDPAQANPPPRAGRP